MFPCFRVSMELGSVPTAAIWGGWRALTGRGGQHRSLSKVRWAIVTLLCVSVGGEVVLLALPAAAGSTLALKLPHTSNPAAAVAAVAHNHVHGSSDQGLTGRQMSVAAVTRPVRATCGPASDWALELLGAAGFEGRLVMVMTLDKWNGWSNGHTFLEIREGLRWVAYDVDRDLRWADEAGRGLSMLELVVRVPSQNYRIVPLHGPVNERLIRRQDARWAQVPFVRGDDGLIYFPSQGARDARILSYSPKTFRILSPTEWQSRFYG